MATVVRPYAVERVAQRLQIGAVLPVRSTEPPLLHAKRPTA